MQHLVNAFRTHSTNAACIMNGCAFLANLCVHRRATQFIVRTGVVPSLIIILKTYRKTDPMVLIRTLRALENIAFGSIDVKDHMKAEGVPDGVEKVEELNKARDDVCRACRQCIEALNRTDTGNDSLQYVELSRVGFQAKASAREIFGDTKEEKAKVVEMPNKQRNMLLAGALLIKHSNTAAPRPRHIYVTADLKFLVWKDPKKPLDPKHKMKIFKVKNIERGRCTPQLQRKKALTGKFLAKEECSFAVFGRDRTVDLETETEAEREKWVDALNMLVEFTRTQKEANKQFTARG